MSNRYLQKMSFIISNRAFYNLFIFYKVLDNTSLNFVLNLKPFQSMDKFRNSTIRVTNIITRLSEKCFCWYFSHENQWYVINVKHLLLSSFTISLKKLQHPWNCITRRFCWLPLVHPHTFKCPIRRVSIGREFSS